MAWINPVNWGGKLLLHLLHITGSSKTFHHHDPQFPAHLPVIVPKINFTEVQFPAHLPVIVSKINSTEVDDPLYNDLVDLPYDIIIDILSRLPAKCIFKCQCVSRPLQVLTTTASFGHMQRQRSTSVIVVQLSSESDCEFTKLYYMDKEFGRIEEKFTRSRSESTTYPNFLLSSYDGFLMFTSFIDCPQTFYMWNPITGEQLTMRDIHEHVCGLYFNPIRKSHELLYYTTYFEYYCNFSIFSLKTKQRRDVGRFSYPPCRYKPPVIVKGALYWMIDRDHFSWFNNVLRPPFLDSIMSFNIETEEFSTLEPGGHKYSTTEPRGEYSDGMLRIHQLHLSEIDGKLCLCDFVTSNQLFLSIFNHETQCWSTRTVITLPEYDLPCLSDGANKFDVEVIQIKNNELLVRQRRRLLLYDMLSHACKISETMGSMKIGIRVTVHTDRISSFYL
ncbi:hypothetical protein MKX03_033054 [Papaver bracteatum]|nr:hypothetical protein MKX03_033054 [Papaver bracteatum]